MAFYQYVKTFNSDTFDYEELDRTDYVFMRWKEHFLVPDHTIKVELEIGFRKTRRGRPHYNRPSTDKLHHFV